MATGLGRQASCERVVLERVPRVGFYHETQQHADTKARCPEDVCFPSCLRACLELLATGWADARSGRGD